jgi:ABC transporter substrate binding protein
MAPDVIVTTGRPATIAAQERTQIIPIVFTAGADPIGLLQNIERPEGNTTGFTSTTETRCTELVTVATRICSRPNWAKAWFARHLSKRYSAGAGGLTGAADAGRPRSAIQRQTT